MDHTESLHCSTKYFETQLHYTSELHHSEKRSGISIYNRRTKGRLNSFKTRSHFNMVSNESKIVFWIFLTIIESLQIFWRDSWVTSKWEPLEGNYWFLSRCWMCLRKQHYNDVIMGAMASQITSLTTVYSTVYSNRRSKKKNPSSVSLAFVRGIHQWPVNSPHRGQ